MPPLTWRNVDMPNLAPAMNGQAQAGVMLDNALKTAGESIATIFKEDEDRANQEVLARALEFGDLASYDQALKSGSLLGSAKDRVSAETLRLLDARRGSLLDQQGKTLGNNKAQIELDKATYDFAQTKELDEILKTASPDFVEAAAFANKGDYQGSVARLRANPRLAELPADKLMVYLEKFSKLTGDGLSQAHTKTQTQAVRQGMALAANQDARAADNHSFTQEQNKRTKEGWVREDDKRTQADEADALYQAVAVKKPTVAGMQEEYATLQKAGAPTAVLDRFVQRAKQDGFNIGGPVSDPAEKPAATLENSLIAGRAERALAQQINNKVIPGVTPTQMLEAYRDGKSSSVEVARRLVEKGGPLEGSNEDDVHKEILWFMEQDKNYSPAVAGLLAVAATRPTSWSSAFNPIDRIGNGRQIDGNAQRALRSHSQADFLLNAAAIDTAEKTGQQLKLAQEKAGKTAAEALAFKLRPGVDKKVIADAEAKAAEAKAKLQELVNAIDK